MWNCSSSPFSTSAHNPVWVAEGYADSVVVILKMKCDRLLWLDEGSRNSSLPLHSRMKKSQVCYYTKWCEMGGKRIWKCSNYFARNKELIDKHFFLVIFDHLKHFFKSVFAFVFTLIPQWLLTINSAHRSLCCTKWRLLGRSRSLGAKHIYTEWNKNKESSHLLVMIIKLQALVGALTLPGATWR